MYERDANYLALDSSTHSLQILKGVGHLTQLFIYVSTDVLTVYRSLSFAISKLQVRC